MLWWEKYIGKPWAAQAEPPQSFNCGELVRYVLKTRLNVEVKPIYADPRYLRQCIQNLSSPDAYDMHPVIDAAMPYDLVFMARHALRDHIGIAVDFDGSLIVLHCQQGNGVTWDTESSLRAEGFRRIDWYRHRAVNREMALCRA
jgi:hypothetical protein